MTNTDLTFTAYQARAKETDRTRTTKPLSFLLLGLFGEIGTLMDEVKKKQRDRRAYIGYEQNVIEELGDVLWYLANIADRSKLSLGAIAHHAVHGGEVDFSKSFDEMSFVSVQAQQLLPLNEPTPEFETTLLELVATIGTLANDYRQHKSNNITLGTRLSATLTLLIRAANEARVTLGQAALENLQKIQDRWPSNPQFPDFLIRITQPRNNYLDR